ncbi:DUF1853 family protein [Bacteroidota bacterium]
MNSNKNLEQYIGFINTPPLFNTPNILLEYKLFFTNELPNKIILNQNPKPKLMLGKRAEHYFKQYLNSNAIYAILKENVQIYKNKTTIGELDFIIQNFKTKKNIHVELTYKFYLYDPNFGSSEIENWVGPNRNDSLSLKLNKLNNKQFPLLYKQETKQTLTDLNMDTIEQQVCFKAQLFIPYSISPIKFQYINSKAIKGYYINYLEFIDILFQKNQIYIPSKQDWLITPNNSVDWISQSESLKTILPSIQNKKSPLIWIKNTNTITPWFITWW